MTTHWILRLSENESQFDELKLSPKDIRRVQLLNAMAMSMIDLDEDQDINEDLWSQFVEGLQEFQSYSIAKLLFNLGVVQAHLESRRDFWEEEATPDDAEAILAAGLACFYAIRGVSYNVPLTLRCDLSHISHQLTCFSLILGLDEEKLRSELRYARPEELRKVIDACPSTCI